MKKLKRIKKNGKVQLSKDASLEQAVAEIQEILVAEDKSIRNKIKVKAPLNEFKGIPGGSL